MSTVSGIPRKQYVCRYCGKVMDYRRTLLGFEWCKECAEEKVTPIRQVEVSASSLQWI